MSAEVTKRPNINRWLAWCEYHQDGYQAGSKRTAAKWANKHNAEHHEPAA
jgi:hypothetical protein